MAQTFRDDLGRFGRRLIETVQDRTGKEVIDRDELALLESVRSDNRLLRKEMHRIGVDILSYEPGLPGLSSGHEVRKEVRQWAARESLTAWIEDPLAGQSVDLYVSFVLGRGVPKAQAHDAEVQDVLDRAWCHDAETEALTDEGWMDYRELRRRWDEGRPPLVAGFDAADDRVVFETPLAVNVQTYAGDMVEAVGQRSPRFCVTPNHRMLTRRRADGIGAWTMRTADEMRSQEHIPVAGVSSGVRQDEFVLPGCLERRYVAERKRLTRDIERHAAIRALRERGLTQYEVAETLGVSQPQVSRVENPVVPRMRDDKKRRSDMRLPMDAWLEWLGWYIAEGDHTSVTVCQSIESPRLVPLMLACGRLGVPGVSRIRDGRIWEWSPLRPKQFREWLVEHVGTIDVTKRLPDFVFGLAVEQREHLLDGLMGGDGGPTDWRTRGRGAFLTSSKQLADDVQRLATITGWRAVLGVADRSATRGTLPEYVVYLHRRCERIVTTRPHTSQRTAYSGDVWCCTMPSGAMVTRRRGATLISGNSDSANQRILTGYPALVEKLIDLCLQSTVFFSFFDDGEDGMVRVSLVRFDDIDDAIRHSELAPPEKGDRFRILYYRARQYVVRYDFESGSRATPRTEPDSTAKTVYYEAWGAFDPDDDVQRVQDEGLRKPPPEKVAPGKVYALSVNKTSEMAFGIPRMRRLMSWYSAWNDTLVSFRDRMQAMASVYMTATAKGSERDLERLGQRALGRASAFGPAQEFSGEGFPHQHHGHGPVRPGVQMQNDALKVEPFKIDSGAGDVSQAAPILRGQVTGPWPESYLSGFAQGSLAGAASLELPTLAFVRREQKLWVDLFTAFGQASIDGAIRVGDLDEWRDPTQAELEQIANAEQAGEPLPFEVDAQGRIKRDLGFTVILPDPLQRAMGDVVNAAVQTATAVDPNGANPELSRWLFGFILAEAFDVEDPMRVVDQVLPRHLDRTPGPDTAAQVDPATGLPLEGNLGADGQRHPPENPYGVPLDSPPPEARKVQETPADDAFAVLERATDEYLALLDALPAVTVNGSSNGNH